MSYIIAAKRSPIASFQGSLSSLSAPEIAAQVIRATLASISQVEATEIEELYMGCVLTAGIGQAPARQAAIKASLPENTPCTTVGKVCGSGLKSVMLADLSLRAGESSLVLAGGMESMTQAPYLIPKLRAGARLGHAELVDSMIKDGLWDAYNNVHMGNAAELCVREHKISREEQDAYAKASYERALAAQSKGLFDAEIVKISLKSKKGESFFATDEEPAKIDFEKMSKLKAVFESDGTITAANASSLSDGAAALLVASPAFVEKKKIQPLARIVAQAQAAQDPMWFTTAPAKSIEKLLTKAQLKVSDIDLWEINEAFAAVALVNQKLLGIASDRINIRGGAIALGHPIGASGARILVTLVHSLIEQKKKYGVASLCIGGGEAVSVLVENVRA
jgi:acetyl-CoA C-acetyltransferase